MYVQLAEQGFVPEYISLLGIGVAGIGWFLAIFYLLRNKLDGDGYTFLYCTLGVLSYEVFYKTLIHSRLIYGFSILYQGSRFFNLLIYPVFLLFIYTVTRKDFNLKSVHKLMLGAFFAHSLFVFCSGLTFSMGDKEMMLNLFYEDRRPGPYNYWDNWETLIKGTVLPLSFLGVIGWEFFRFRRKSTAIRNKRLLNCVSLVIVMYFLFNQFANCFYQWAFELTGYSMIEWPVDIVFLSSIVILLAVVVLSVNSGDTFFPPSKYMASALNQKDYASILTQTRHAIQSEQLFKNGKLTIADLSGQVGVNAKYLSQAINHHLGIGFTDFINQYRVEEAKKLLMEAGNQSLTIEAVGNLAGFHSKTTFFRTFKKITGLTPKQFIEESSKK